MNKSDSEKIAGVLEKHGYLATERLENANMVILNTCAVRKSAEDRFFSFLRKCKKLKNKNNLKIGVTGCLLKTRLKRILDFADFTFKIKDLPALGNNIDHDNTKHRYKEKSKSIDYLSIEAKRESKSHAYIPIMSGCDNFCSYCAIPFARGKEISRPSKDIIKEIENLLNKNYKAFTLLGQNVNSYGKGLKENTDFTKLLEKICDLEGDFWIWFLSSHPKDMKRKLINVIAKEKKICKYLHFALQSGSNRILTSMNRHYTKEKCQKLISYIYQKMPGISLSTDIIVGFPGETRKDFKETLDLCQKSDFEMAYIGRFSKRPLTKAYVMKETVSNNEKKSREKELQRVIAKNNLRRNERFIGKKKKVLVDQQIISKGKKKNVNRYIGKTAEFKTVKFVSKKKIKNGNFVRVLIKKVLDFGLEGEIT